MSQFKGFQTGRLFYWWEGQPFCFIQAFGRLGKGYLHDLGFPGDSDGKESTCNAGDAGLIPGSGGSPGGGNVNLLWYSCWRISQTEEPDGLQSMHLQRARQLSD